MLNGIRCDKLFTAVAAIKAHPDKYENDFDAVVAFPTQYVDKRATTLSVKVASVTQTRPANQQKISASCGIFKGKVELKKYSRKDCDSMLMAHNDNSYMSSRKKLYS